MNIWIGIGRLTKDPEARQTTSKIAVTTFTLAVDRKYKDASGEKQTDFINCIAWKGTAEFVSKYATKGTKLAVTGEVQTRTYDDKSGKKVYVTEINCHDVEFAESKKSDQSTAKQDAATDYDDDTEPPFDV